MTTRNLLIEACARFHAAYERAPTVAAYAPGRVEILGNHTDYNEGFVLSAAIDRGTVLVAAPVDGPRCTLVAGDLMARTAFDLRTPTRDAAHAWANYVLGVAAELPLPDRTQGFEGLFFSSVPLGAGLSSSAALEMAAAKALCALYGVDPDPLTLARAGQLAEHRFAGVRCGLLDQISSLFGREGHLVYTDFRSLRAEALPMGAEAVFLLFDTKVKHRLVDSAYNERREACESATAFFATALGRPVAALRDVSWAEFEAHSGGLPERMARRAAHVIGENRRVQEGRKALAAGDLAAFGRLMFASHDSSRHNFENSCPELDILVDAAAAQPGALGARLSGGGFGGSVVALARPAHAHDLALALHAAYLAATGREGETMVTSPSAGAHVLSLEAPTWNCCAN